MSSSDGFAFVSTGWVKKEQPYGDPAQERKNREFHWAKDLFIKRFH
jgi:hypothetical protein